MPAFRLHLGFDTEFDRSAPATRAKTVERVGLSVAVLAVAFIAIGPIAISWWGVSILAEAMLWRATTPRYIEKQASQARALRVAASAVASSAWALCALLLWFAGTPVSALMAISLLAAISLYIIASCHETPIHMIAAGTPPALGLLILPVSLPGSIGDRILLISAMGLLVAFGVSSAVRAYRTHMRLQETRRLLEEQTRSAQAANRAKSDFLANMSHEIRTPLNGVLAVSEALSHTPLSARQKGMLELVSSSGQVLQQLLSDILDLARIETAQLKIQRAPFDLHRAVTEVARLHAPVGEARGLTFTVDLEPEVEGYVMGDLVRFKQVLTNLISNAIKFTEAGHVRLTGRREVGTDPVRFRFTVEDTGVGFGEDERQKLFRRFEQADGSITRRFGGSGLGLSICGELITLMEGDIDCDSKPGQGSRFTFALPLEPHSGPIQTHEPAQIELGRKLRVLVADDHPTNRKVVELVLSQAGVDLVMAEDGAQAVEAVKAERFDAILMDMQMPVMDGLTATRTIRTLERETGRSRTPIFMLTANALPEHVDQARAAGADLHIAKPLKAAELLAALSNIGQDPDAAIAVA